MGLIALSAACLLAAMALTFCEITGWRAGQWVFKPLASALFVLVALSLGGMAGGAYGWCILIALGLCFIGDIVLIPRGSETLFKIGIGVFLAGHVAYVIAFLVRGVALTPMIAGAVVMAIITVFYWRYISTRIGPDFKREVGAYTGVIFIMVVTAFGAATNWVLPAAALMFAVSDMMVGHDRFVKTAPVNFIVITPFYYGAQVLFAWSVLG